MQDSLSGRAAELAHLTDLIRTSLSLADAAIPLINEQLNGLAEMGIDNLELEGPPNLFPDSGLVAGVRRRADHLRRGTHHARRPRLHDLERR